MGKRSSSTAAAAASGSQKTKRSATAADSDAPAISKWSHTKFMDKDLRKAAKDGLLKDDTAEVCMAGPEATPTPPARFRVMFLAFVLCGLSFPLHDFLHGLLFVYGIQLHDLNPNTILHIACFIMLCKCFLGIKPHWHYGGGSSSFGTP
jgi:hypothetical protein